MRAHYVYAHRRGSDRSLFYIGKGKGSRAWSSSGRSRHWYNIARKHGFTVEIVKGELPEQCALTLEQILIGRVGLSNLANATLGGGGTQGWRHSDEARQKISAAVRKRGQTEKQREALRKHHRQTFTPEYRAKMSAAAKAREGRIQSPETRAKISASHIGLRPSEETRAKQRHAHLGKHCGRDSGSYDHTLRHFAHDVHGTFVGTRGDLIARFLLSSSDMSALLKGKRKSVKGWRLLP